jgi:hypothetical protein
MLESSPASVLNVVYKKEQEQIQITPEALQGGFKAADKKATFDLIPISVFRYCLNGVIPEKYEDLTAHLLDFWEIPAQSDQFGVLSTLWDAFDAAFALLAEETGGEIPAIFAIGELYALGKAKYAARNWEKGIDWGIVWAATFRHLLYRIKGEAADPVDGQLHMTSVCWNIIALIHFVNNLEKYQQFDSRQIVIRAENKGQK